MIYHLSHIDLDGYGCQYMSEQAFGKGNVKFFNSNYGKEIELKLEKILKLIAKRPNEQHTILITDLNLTDEVSDDLSAKIDEIHNVELLLIDHHGTGKNSAEKHDWYHLDTTKCATKLTFEYFEDKLKTKNNYDLIKDISDYVNVTDMWLSDHPDFKKANLLSDLIFSAMRFPRMLEEHNAYLRLSLIENTVKEIKKGNTIRDIESQIISIKEKFLKGRIKEDVFLCQETQLEHKFYRYMYELLIKKEIPTIKIGESTGKVFHDIGSSAFQQISHMYNTEIGDVDFVVHVNDKGSLSFRSIGDDPKNKVDVIAERYFGGGGHPNAAGAKLGENIRNLSYDKALMLMKEKVSNG